MKRTTADPVQTLGQAIQDAINRRVLDIHTSMPGIVEAWDAETQTIEVVIAMKRTKVDGTEIPALKLSNVRVMFPKTSQHIMRFPLTKGDEVLLIFHERDVDNWRGTGSVGRPATNRKFSLSDVVALPGYSSDAKLPVLDAGDETGFSLYFGDVKIVLTANGQIKIGKKGSDQTEPLVLGNVMLSFMTDLIAQVKKTATDIKTGPVGIGNAGSPTPTHPTLIAKLATIEAALNTIKTTYVDTASTNVVSQVSFTERGGS